MRLTRVPLLVRWPGVIRRGTTCPHPAYISISVPTILDAFGFAIPRILEGKSMMPTLCDPGQRVNDVIFVSSAGMRSTTMVSGAF